jgi:hypothetical protein
MNRYLTPASTQAACFFCPGPTPTQAPQGQSPCDINPQPTCCTTPSATCDCSATYGGSVKKCCAMFSYAPPNCAQYNGGGGSGGGGSGGGSGGSSSHGGSVSVPKPKPKVIVVTSDTTSKEKPKAKAKVSDRLSPTQTPPPHHLIAGPGRSSGASAFAGVALGSAVVVALAYGWSKRRVVNIAGAEEDHGIITLADVARLERRKRRAEAQAAAKEQSQIRKVESKKGWAKRFAAAVKSKYLAGQETKANIELSETPYASA